MTPRKQQIARFIRDHRRQHHVSPTVREIAAHLGIAATTVHEHLQIMLADGIVTRDRLSARSYALAPGVMLGDEPEISWPIGGTIDDNGITWTPEKK